MLSPGHIYPTPRGPPMTPDGRLTDLLLQWENLRELGQAPSPEGLCRDHPELLAPFREAIRALAGLDPLLGTVAAAPAVETAAPWPGAFPRRYRPLGLHARGGLGEVYLAEDTELDRRVALKEIQGRFADHPDSRARFLREGR